MQEHPTDPQSTTPPRCPASERERRLREVEQELRASFDRMDWCRCSGAGFWYEQIDGVKMRRVDCPRHPELWETSDTSEKL